MYASIEDNNMFKQNSFLNNNKNREQHNNINRNIILEKEQELLFAYSTKIKALEEQLREKNNKVYNN